MGNLVTAMGYEKKTELKKHAATIHCSNTLTLLQRKISNALLYHAYKDIMTKEEHEISIRQLCNLISYNGNNHGAIKDALKGLLSTVIEWNLVNDTTGLEDWTASAMLASVSLQGPLCYYAYSPRMKQLLYSPSMFGKINLYIQARFKSSYGLALYENCTRYRGLPYTKWFDIELFRKLMGVPADNYTIFRDFKRRVLDKSVEEVNTYSDILVEPELYRERRQVVKLRFLLKERAKKIRLGTLLEPENTANTAIDELRSKMINAFSLSPKQTEQILQDYKYEFIMEKIHVIESSKNYQQGKVKNIAAYFKSALKNDYQMVKTSEVSLRQKKQEETRAKENLQEIRRLCREMEVAYLVYKEKTVDTSINALTARKKQKFMQSFYESAETSIRTILKLQRKKYTQKTILQSPQIKALLREFAIRTLPNLNEVLIPMDKFIEQHSEQHRNAWYQLKLIAVSEVIL